LKFFAYLAWNAYSGPKMGGLGGLWTINVIIHHRDPKTWSEFGLRMWIYDHLAYRPLSPFSSHYEIWHFTIYAHLTHQRAPPHFSATLQLPWRRFSRPVLGKITNKSDFKSKSQSQKVILNQNQKSSVSKWSKIKIKNRDSPNDLKSKSQSVQVWTCKKV